LSSLQSKVERLLCLSQCIIFDLFTVTATNLHTGFRLLLVRWLANYNQNLFMALRDMRQAALLKIRAENSRSDRQTAKLAAINTSYSTLMSKSAG